MSTVKLPDRFNMDDGDEEGAPEKSVPSRKLSLKKERTNQPNRTSNVDALVITADEFTRSVHPDLKRVPVNGQGAEYLKNAMSWYAQKRRMSLTDARDAAFKAFIPTDIQKEFFQRALDSSGYELTEADYYPGKYDTFDDDKDNDIDG